MININIINDVIFTDDDTSLIDLNNIFSYFTEDDTHEIADVPTYNMKIADMPTYNMKIADIPTYNMKIADMPTYNMKIADMPTYNMKIADMPTYALETIASSANDVQTTDIPLYDDEYTTDISIYNQRSTNMLLYEL